MHRSNRLLLHLLTVLSAKNRWDGATSILVLALLYKLYEDIYEYMPYRTWYKYFLFHYQSSTRVL